MLVKEVTIHSHSSDLNVVRMTNARGDVVYYKEGYLPVIPNVSGGDDLRITIDNATGQVIGWKPITQEDIEKLIEDL